MSSRRITTSWLTSGAVWSGDTLPWSGTPTVVCLRPDGDFFGGDGALSGELCSACVSSRAAASRTHRNQLRRETGGEWSVACVSP
jgi:hypothetical protein